MENHKLTKEEALKLLTPVVDGEATHDERRAFLSFIENNEEVRLEYESIQKLKSAVAKKYRRDKAPESLENFVKQIATKASVEKAETPIYDIPTGGPSKHRKMPLSEQKKSANSLKRYLFYAAAALIVIASGWTFINISDEAASYNLEEHVYEHFEKNKGQFVEPTISTANLGSAQHRLASDYDMPMAIPELQNAEFKGVVYDDFVPGYKAPMLEYYLSSEDQYIYIFAFQVTKMEKFGKLVRNQDAVKACTKPKDFHIRNINGKHVVSWKWNDVWYAAISNHDGNTLASLVEPLQYNPEE